MSWMSSMLSDGDNGSVSSKRVITVLAFILCGVSFMLDQVMGFKADPHLFDAMMYIVIAGLGFTASEKFASKK
jgi:hypothetical protein